jgi:hypothetical protein
LNIIDNIIKLIYSEASSSWMPPVTDVNALNPTLEEACRMLIRKPGPQLRVVTVTGAVRAACQWIHLKG